MNASQIYSTSKISKKQSGIPKLKNLSRKSSYEDRKSTEGDRSSVLRNYMSTIESKQPDKLFIQK